MKKSSISALPKWIWLLAGIVLGALIILAIRFVTYDAGGTHYHANFAVYLNGQRQDFKDPKYYQEVNICTASSAITLPQQRVHMHDEVNSVVHVHDHAVTWGEFFQNIGWSVGPDYLIIDSGQQYFASGDTKLHVIIDGQDYTDLGSVSTMAIKDRQRLLISFGDVSSQTLQQEYKSVPTTAKHYDESKDPSSCASSAGTTTSERLHHLF